MPAITGFTVATTRWFKGAEILGRRTVFPTYVAVTMRSPIGALHGGSVATPERTEALPSRVVPSKNLTVPVGVPLPGGVTETLADSVNGVPSTAGFWPEATLMDVVSSARNTEMVLDP